MKKYNLFDILFHLIFWIIAGYLFCNNSYIRIHPLNEAIEYYCLIILILVIYINYFFITPLYLSKNKIALYFIFTLSILIIATILEFYIIKNDILLFTSKANKSFQNGMLRWNFYGIFFRDALFVGFFTVYRIYRDAIKAYNLLQINTDLERQQFITRIDLIKSKINTHFFFNSLNSIYSLVLDKSDEAPGILLNLSDLMEYVVKDSEQEWVPLDDEIKFLQNYIALERIVNQNIQLQFDITGETKLYKVPPLIFEAFVNNAFKYTDFDNQGYIHINLSCNAGEIIFSCENTVYTTDTNTAKSTAKGLKNTNNRLDLVYKDHYKLDITNEEGKFKVLLAIKN